MCVFDYVWVRVWCSSNSCNDEAEGRVPSSGHFTTAQTDESADFISATTIIHQLVIIACCLSVVMALFIYNNYGHLAAEIQPDWLCSLCFNVDVIDNWNTPFKPKIIVVAVRTRVEGVALKVVIHTFKQVLYEGLKTWGLYYKYPFQMKVGLCSRTAF